MIVATTSGDRELRVASLDGIAAMELQAGGGRLTAGVVVDGKALGALPAASMAIRTASWAVGKRQLCVCRGKGIDKKEVTTTWQARFFGSQPNSRESWFDVMVQTEASLTARNNAFWLKSKDRGQVVDVIVVHPDGVDTRWNKDKNAPEYRVHVPGMGWTDWIDASYVLHFREGFPQPGAIVAPTPIQLHREAIGAAAAKYRAESLHFQGGLQQAIAVVFPKEVTSEQAERYRQTIMSEHGGVENSNKVHVFGGGAQVQTIGLSLEDAAFVEAKGTSAKEMLQILGMPASLADASDSRSRLPTPENEEDRWNRYWLEPRLTRIQECIKTDVDFFGPAARDYPAFGDVIVKGDRATESARLVAETQAGIRLPDEARAELGLPPLPNGVGQIPQITPVGGAPNPNLNVPIAQPDGEDEENDDYGDEFAYGT